MAYQVDWVAKNIVIPKADLTLDPRGDPYYILDMAAFWIEIRRLENDPTEGLWADQILQYTNSDVISGIPFVPGMKVINNYTVEFEDDGGPTGRYAVACSGSNHNLLDVKVFNQVSLAPNLSAGLVFNANQALGQGDLDNIRDNVWNAALGGYNAGSAGDYLNDLKGLVYTKGQVVNDQFAGLDSFQTNLGFGEDLIGNGFHATIVWITGNNAGLVREVYRYTALNSECYVFPFLVSMPVNGDEFIVVSSSTGADAHRMSYTDSTQFIKSAVWNTSVSGYSSGSAGGILSRISAVAFAKGSVSDSNPGSSQFDTDLIADDDNSYEGCILLFTSSGSLRYHSRPIVSYDGGTKRVGVWPAFDVPPADGDLFTIIASNGYVNVDRWKGNAVQNNPNGYPTVNAEFFRGQQISTDFYDRLNSLFITKGQTVAGTLLQNAFTTDLTETTLNHYKTQFVVFITGPNTGASRPIVGYAVDGTITVSPWFSSAPDAGDEFVIMSQTMSSDVNYWNGQAVPGGPAGVPAVNVTYVDNVGPAKTEIGKAPWDRSTSQHETAGTFGKLVSDIFKKIKAILAEL